MNEKIIVVLAIITIGAMFVRFVDIFPKIMTFVRVISVILALFTLFSNWDKNYPVIKKMLNFSIGKAHDFLVYIYNFAINNSDEFIETIKTITR